MKKSSNEFWSFVLSFLFAFAFTVFWCYVVGHHGPS